MWYVLLSQMIIQESILSEQSDNTMSPTLILPSPPPDPSMARWQRLSRILGFQKSYNFLIWVLLALPFLGFSLSRLGYFDYFNVFCRKNYLSRSSHAAPGECYYFLNGGREQIGMMVHLYGIIPASLLVFFQFIPAIRQRAVLFHRINGYIVLVLTMIAVVGGLLASPGSFGGEPTWQAVIWVVGVMVFTGLVLAMVNIKRLQIEQHRAWMLRTWAWVSTMLQYSKILDATTNRHSTHDKAFSTITMRIIQIFVAGLISGRGHVASRPCAQVGSDGVVPIFVLEQRFSGCATYFTGKDPHQTVIVNADYYGLPMEINVALSLAAGVSAFLALFLHSIAVEIYVSSSVFHQEGLSRPCPLNGQ